MAKKVSITNVEATENIYTVTYETGTVKQYTGDKLPKTVVAWIEAYKAEEPAEEPTEEETETAKGAEIIRDVMGVRYMVICRFNNGVYELVKLDGESAGGVSTATQEELDFYREYWKEAEPTDSTPETTKAAETVAEVETEENTTEEAATAENVAEVATDEREESTMKKSGAYEHELLKLANDRERREKITGGIFWNLENIILMLTGLTLTAAAAIVYGLAVAASWAAANVPTMISTAQKAAQKAIEAARMTAEVTADTFKAFFHIGRKAATVAATIITMITR